MSNVIISDEFDDAYFFINNNRYLGFIPILMLASMHTEAGEDGFINVVFVTVSGERYIEPGFETISEAHVFCEKQMKEISEYRRACAYGRDTSDKI